MLGEHLVGSVEQSLGGNDRFDVCEIMHVNE